MPSSSKASTDKPPPWALVQFSSRDEGGGERVKKIGKRVEEKREREEKRVERKTQRESEREME